MVNMPGVHDSYGGNALVCVMGLHPGPALHQRNQHSRMPIRCQHWAMVLLIVACAVQVQWQCGLLGVRVGEALRPGPEPAEADKERAEIIGKLRKYSSIGKLSMDQMRRVFPAAHLAGLSFADDLGQLKNYARRLIAGAEDAQPALDPESPPPEVGAPIEDSHPALEGPAIAEPAVEADPAAADATSSAASAGLGRYSGTLKKDAAYKAAFKQWLADVGDIVRARLVSEGHTDRSSIIFRVAVRSELTATFKANSPGVIAYYYRKGGYEPPAGLEHLSEPPLTPEEREWGMLAIRAEQYELKMKEVHSQNAGTKYATRRLLALQQLREEFNALGVAGQRRLALRRKLALSPMNVPDEGNADEQELSEDESCSSDNATGQRGVGWRDLSANSRHKARRAEELRDSLDTAAGGDVDAEDVAEVLYKVLSSEERSVVAARFAACAGTDATWCALGKALVTHLVKTASRRFEYAMVILCLALRDVGFNGRRAIHQKLNIWVWRNPWKTSRWITVAPTRVRPCNNGRLNTRKYDPATMRQFLCQNSVSTSDVVASSKRKRPLNDSADGEPVPKRALNDTAYELWTPSSSTFYQLDYGM